eukprot:TRINITY_DN3507_c3_g1_i1.p1 TRINITY_DN3507_c3_g1~~TRINITY_DN3507_c3_g1_i1.p1  ORF type:complete len:560 (+),score=60.12 TRINITY_DN3507_c3_g1_i1:55-1734(+)
MWFAAPVVVGAALTDLRKVPYVGKYLEQWSLAEKFRKMRYVLYAVCIVLVLVVVRFVLDLLRDILLWRAKSVAEKWFLKVKDSSGGGLQGMTLPVAYTSKALLNTISCNLGRNGESDISRIFIGYDRVEIPPLALSDTLVTLQGNGCNNLIEVQFKKGGVYGGNKPACTATSYITYIMLLVVVMCCGAVCVWAFFVGRRTPSRSTAKPVVVNTVRERKKVEHHTPPQTSCYVMHNAWASKGWTKQSIAMSMSEEGVRISTVSNKNTPSVLYDLSEAVVNEILFASPAGENGKTMLVTSPSKGFMIQFPSENEHVSWLAAVKSVAKFVFTLREFLQVKLKAAPGECVSTLSVSATLCVDIAQKSITVCNDETVVAQISMNNLQYAVHNGVVHLRSSSLGCSGFSFIPPDRSIDRWVEILREHAVLYDPPKHDIQGLMYVTPKGGARKLSLVSFCSVKMELTHAACPVGVGGHVAWPFVRSWLSSARPVTLSFTAVSQSSQSGFTVHTVPVGHHADPCVQEHFDAWNKRFSQTKLSSPPVFSRLMDSPTADRGILEKWGIK